jgi:hypothetical protein
MPPGGDVVAADAAELKTLSSSAGAARDQVENVARQAGAIVGGLDGRGWNIGAVQARWSSARAGFGLLATNLAAAAVELGNRAILVDLFEKLSFGAPGAATLDGYTLHDLADFADDLFPSHGFQESKFSKDFKLLLNGKPTAKTLAKLRGKLSEDLLPTAASIAERARQLALHGSPAGAGRRINTLDKLDPTISYQLNLLDANAAVYGFSIGGKNANLSAEVLAAHAHASAGLSADWQRRRFTASFDIGAAANLADVHAYAGEQVGNSMLGAGGNVTADAAVGANADARAGLTMDALKGKLTGDVGADAFAGASADAQGSLEGDLGGAKTALVGSATAYAGVGIGLKADGTLDLSKGKFGFNIDAGAALGVGAKFDLGLNVDVSGVPHAIGDAAKDFGHAVASLVPHHVKIGPVSLW